MVDRTANQSQAIFLVGLWEGKMGVPHQVHVESGDDECSRILAPYPMSVQQLSQWFYIGVGKETLRINPSIIAYLIAADSRKSASSY